jgi:hypothetical protein
LSARAIVIGPATTLVALKEHRVDVDVDVMGGASWPLSDSILGINGVTFALSMWNMGTHIRKRLQTILSSVCCVVR